LVGLGVLKKVHIEGYAKMVYLNRKAKEEAELERQKRLSVGKYTAEEAVQTLLDHNPHIEITPIELINQLKKLVQDGEIDCFRGGDNFIAPLTIPFRKYDTEFRWDDLNEDWLDKYTIEIRTSWRFPTPEIFRHDMRHLTEKRNVILNKKDRDDLIGKYAEEFLKANLERTLVSVSELVTKKLAENGIKSTKGSIPFGTVKKSISTVWRFTDKKIFLKKNSKTAT
jgi:hypothetical protein